MKKRIISILLLTTLLLSSCGKNEEKIDTDGNVSAETIEKDKEIINNIGPIDPNDPSQNKDEYDFSYIPAIYMQDYEDVTMPNGKTVAESGNLVTVLSMVASYHSQKWITPDVLIKDYPELFDDNGNIIISDTLNTFSGEGTYEVLDYDFNTLAEGLAGTYDFAIVRIPHPSKYGNLSTYLIIEGFSDDMKVGVRDPNKNNVETYSDKSYYDNIPRYDVGDLLVALGQGTQMYMFYGEPTNIDVEWEDTEVPNEE